MSVQEIVVKGGQVRLNLAACEGCLHDAGQIMELNLLS